MHTLLGRPVRSPEDEKVSLTAPVKGRYHQLTNTTSQETLSSSSPPPSRPSADGSRLYRRSRRPETEGLRARTHARTHTHTHTEIRTGPHLCAACVCVCAGPSVLVTDGGPDSPGDPEVPTVVLDSQTRRRFLDLG